MQVITMDEQQRRERVEAEADWQRFAAPLAVVREIREAVLAKILLGEDEHGVYRRKFTEILKLESKLLCAAMAHNHALTVNLLNLAHIDSWREVVEILALQGQHSLAARFRDLVAFSRPIVDEFYKTFDEP